MYLPKKPQSDDVDELLRNAQLRDELEPLLDDSVTWIDSKRMPVRLENDFLESMLAWERAPMVPISQWFEPQLVLPSPDCLDKELLQETLRDIVTKLFDKRIVLDFTDHLTDRELYCLIYRDILPTHEKKIDRTDGYLHWDCSDSENNPETWLRYYASPEERRMWLDQSDDPLPDHEEPPFPRRLPRADL